MKESDYDSSYSSSYYYKYYYGGAIHATTLRLKGNSRVTFTGNEVNGNIITSYTANAYGGAIYGANGASITISETSGAVTFAQNKATGSSYSYSYSYGGAIYGESSSTISICDNEGDVNITGNSASAFSRSYTDSYGGAIYGDQSSTISICDNEGDVNITGNSASASSSYSSPYSYGGAIYGDQLSTISISGNAGAINITGNSTSSSVFSYGGAIYGGSSSTISISSNTGDVNITENTAHTTSESYGGAIYGGSSSTISICGNEGDVNITGNSARYGGAISGDQSSTISISGNAGAVNITGNSAMDGGAIYGANYSTISISGNAGAVNITGNSASYFGAIYGANYSTISISDNTQNVLFDTNKATFGGAIAGDTSSAINLSGSITFSNNDATSIGGAIYSTGQINLNGNITFSGNTAAKGGAIYGSEVIIRGSAETVTFSDNSTTGEGAAIYSTQSIYIQDSAVDFSRNYEKVGSNYRLRSIYMSNTASDGGHFHLSTTAGKNIEFRDSVYIDSGSIVELNADYTNSEGNVIKQEGDIIFTGAYTETHLNELLTANGAGRTATAEEIANSRTSEMHGKVTLYGGTLRVEEQAVLKTTAGLDVAAGSNATVKVSNAELDAGSSDINVGDSGALMLMNGSTVKAANINIANGATFAVVAAPAQEAVATFSLREAASVAEPPQSCLVGANLTFEAGSTLVADGVYFSMTEGSTLTFKALTGGDKINLVLTLGAEYSDNDQVVLFSDVDVVRFILDGVELNATDTILANTFFTGAWVNDETTLSYDSSNGTISVQHLNTVSIPEPTTATLSLLALAALAAHRRRR